MSKLDPRNDVHVFGLCSGKIDRGKDFITFNTCTRCFLKIIQQKASQQTHPNGIECAT
jgi:hypothetical protein